MFRDITWPITLRICHRATSLLALFYWTLKSHPRTDPYNSL
jgi:hypothetical protein